MMFIKSSNIQFKSPVIGKPSRAVEEHYNGRSIIVSIDGEGQMFRFKASEMPFVIEEDEMIALIEKRISEEK